MGVKGKLSGRVTLVTGASRGIGRGIAMQLGEAATAHFVTGPQGLSEQVHKGQYESTLPADTHVVLHIDLFRVERENKIHFRPTRNGLGGWAMGQLDLVSIYNDLTNNPNRRK